MSGPPEEIFGYGFHDTCGGDSGSPQWTEAADPDDGTPRTVLVCF